jgi:hypothetical protein
MRNASSYRVVVYTLLFVLAVSIIVVGLTREQRRLPVPPQVQHVSETFMPGVGSVPAARKTTYWVPIPVEDVRRFYQRELPHQGWRYCGTQATPGCRNMQQFPEAATQIDVYRRIDDRDATGTTIEIWPIWNADQRQTFVTVFETSPL